MSFNNGEMVGSYRIMEQLGQGGMATVFKAYHAALDRYVALKVLHPALLEDKNFLSRFQREARVVAKLEHPNIVPVHDFAEHEGQPYLVMKFIEGETLKAHLQEGKLSPGELPCIVEAVGSALSYAHRQGILHRDIKPSNVMMATDGHIYLADFGLARIAGAGESTLTSDMIVGTPQYISPEQATGKKDLDEGTDIYSFGVMLYELVVGRVPFSADTPYAVIHAHIYSPLPLPSDVNPSVVPEMERMLLKALAKERQDRYKDVSEFLSAFKEAWEAQTTMGLRTSGMQPAPIPEVETVPAATPVSEPSTPSTVVIESKPEPRPEPVHEPAPEGRKKRKGKRGWLLMLIGLFIAALVFYSRHSSQLPGIIQTVQLTVFPSQTFVPVSARPVTRVPAPVHPPKVLYQSDFGNNSLPEGWNAESGWKIKEGALCGEGHSFIGNSQSGWRDYVAAFRLKVDKGSIHLNLRSMQEGGLNRYFIGFYPDSGLSLNKQVAETFSSDLNGIKYELDRGRWYDVQMVAQGQRILLLVDGAILLDYTDPQPLASGGISFETLEDSSACIDDLSVTDLTGEANFDIISAQDFNGQNALSGWQLMDAAGGSNNAWGIQTGVLCGSEHNWAIFRDLELANFDVRFRLSVKNGSAHLNFRFHDQPYWRYRIRVDTTSSNVTLFRSSAREEKTLVAGRALILPSKWYDLRVSLFDSRIQLWINDKRVFDVTDKNPVEAGFIGFESLEGTQNVCIDDFVVTKPSLAQVP